jgi:hypothetical protein
VCFASQDRYGETVILARIIRELRLELEKRQEYALRYMVSVDSARTAVEATSTGAAFELKRIAECVAERRRRGCRLGPRTENAGSWKCIWCGCANVRQDAGLDHCSACNAEALTYFTGVENELRVRYSRPRLRLSRRAVQLNSNGVGLSAVNGPVFSS